MYMFKKVISDKNPNSINRRSRILILASGGLSSIFSMIILMAASRAISIEETGILTIAIAIAKLFLNIGKYGMRNYQVTEVQDVTFSEWLRSRVITVTIMIMCSIGYVIYQIDFHGYTMHKASIVVLLCLIYTVECVEDIYTGYYQKTGRLDISSYIQTMRYVVLIIVFSGTVFFTQDLFWASLLSFFVSIIIVYFYAFRTLKFFESTKAKPRMNVVKKLLVDCLPLCLMSFIQIYVSNAPKYEIDNIYNADVQAYFGFISMPIFTIGLLSGFVFQPQLVSLSLIWKSKDYKKFAQIVRRQIIYILGISVICILAGWFLGIRVLAFLYGVRGLEEYKNIFIVLLIGGAGTAMINFITALLVIFRRQRVVLYAHLIVGVAIFISIKIVISKYGIMGAVLDTTICIWLLALVLISVYVYELYLAQKCAKTFD